MRKHVVLSLSGGLDSTSLLAWLLEHEYAVTPVIFMYGSKHNKYENEAAKKVCRHYQLAPIECDLSKIFSVFKSNLLASGGPIPEGHYSDETMKQTVVPGRNLIFISILAGIAESVGADNVAIGVHAGDHAIYPDCRPLFIKLADDIIFASTEAKVALLAPFLHVNKAQVLSFALRNNSPIELTRTCYKDQPIACGKCGSCVERLEAFDINGMRDVIEYEN